MLHINHDNLIVCVTQHGNCWVQTCFAYLCQKETNVRYTTCKQKPIIGVIRSNRLRWCGHVSRMNDSKLPKKVWKCTVTGTRPRGRPRKSWDECIKDDLRACDIPTHRLPRLVHDRGKWRKIVEDARSRGHLVAGPK